MEPKKYRKRPVTVEAIQWTGSNFEQLKRFAGWYADAFATPDGNCLMIRTLEGNYVAKPSDYIIKGVHGEFYPCKADIFRETYEEAEETIICTTTGQPCAVCQPGPCDHRREEANHGTN